MPEPLHLKFVHFPKGSFIIVEGKLSPAEEFYIVREGKVFITRISEVVADEGSGLMGPGDFFGVVATMSRHPHIETAQAVTDCVLISVRREQFEPLIRLNAPVAMKIILQFSRRMRFLDTALAEKTLDGISETDGPGQIFNVADYYTRQGQFGLAFAAYTRYLAASPAGSGAAAARERLVKMGPYVGNLPPEPDRSVFVRQYAGNTLIFSEGESGDEMYIIRSGTVKIIKIVDRQEVLLAVLRGGDIFGEMALLESKPRAACAVAYEDCVIMAVNRANFGRLAETQPEMISRLTSALAERIWLVYRQLANTLIQNPLGRLWDALLIQLLRAGVPLNAHAPHTFDFGPKELVNMVGLSRKDGSSLLAKVFDHRRVYVSGDRIVTDDVIEIVRQADILAKLEKLANSRRATSRRRIKR